MFSKRKLPKPRKDAWFIPLHWSYLPATWQGWLTYIPYTAFLIGSYVIVDRNTTELWALAFVLLPYWVSATVVMHWIASHKS